MQQLFSIVSMRSIKAIVIGSLFIVIVTLLLQLAYIFIAVGYNALAKNYLFLNDISGYFKYIIGLPVFMAIMFVGGYITASIANMKALPHCVAVALITVGGMMYSAMENSNLTLTGIVVIDACIKCNLGGWLILAKWKQNKWYVIGGLK